MTSRTTTSTKRKGRAAPANKPVAGWVWMLTGLVIGGGVMAIANFFAADKDAAPVASKPAQATAAKPTPRDPGLADNKDEVEEKRYRFYDALPDMGVDIPEREIRERQAKLAPKEEVDYILQAGSFRTFSDADSVKAQLALLGVEAEVDPVVSKGVEWFRVRVGPYSNKRELNKVRNRIQRNQIDTLVIKIPRPKTETTE